MPRFLRDGPDKGFVLAWVVERPGIRRREFGPAVPKREAHTCACRAACMRDAHVCKAHCKSFKMAPKSEKKQKVEERLHMVKKAGTLQWSLQSSQKQWQGQRWRS